MRRTLREALALVFRAAGLALVVRHTYARRRVAILVYHRPSPRILERHLRYITRHYHLITLDRLVDALWSGRWAELPQRSVVITFDDGHASNAELLEPLRHATAASTIFICTQIVGSRRRFWTDVVAGRDLAALKRVPDEARLRRLRDGYDFSPADEFAGEPRAALSVEEIRSLLEVATFGSHTRFHPVLPTCSDDVCWDEIARSREEVSFLTGAGCHHFCFPNGSCGEREVSMVRDAGYSSARTTQIGWVGPRSDAYRLKVLGVEDRASVTYLAAVLSGLGIFTRVASNALTWLTGRIDSMRPRFGAGSP